MALIGVVFGGAGLKLIESIMTRDKDKADVATQFREELRTEVSGLRDELHILDDRLNKSRQMYYTILHAFNMAKGELLKHGDLESVQELEAMVKNATKDSNNED